MEKTRTATCACGSLRVLTRGEPDTISMCHCDECQRRSGSPFGVGVFFRNDQVEISGAHNSFRRPAPEGRFVTNHFCPRCGTSVFWEADKRPGFCIVALGCFADPAFPPPTRSVFERDKHPWIAFGIEIPTRRH